MHPRNFAWIGLILAIWSTLTAFVKGQYYPIDGLQIGIGPNGARPARRNILDLQNDEPSWSLYVQALAAMQEEDENYPLSYFQIAGIHGRPYIPWNNVPRTQNAPLTGYCTHSSVLFLPWHRPYLALFEQIIGFYAQQIADMYPEDLRPSYQAAATNFRLPYWDWASNPNIPDAVTESTLQITTPQGVQIVNSPLMRYRFQNYPLNTTLFPPPQDGFLTSYPQTLRCPDEPVSNAVSDPATANSNMIQGDLKQYTYYAFTRATTFDEFCTIGSSGISMEGVHNSVHVAIGGNYGHMSYLSYAAFDPIFWLHHTNVDRMYALWEAIYYNETLTPLMEQQGTFVILPNSITTTATMLEPFATTYEGNFWTVNSVWQTSAFGYTYPEIEDWSQSPAELMANVTLQINKLYAPYTSNLNRKRYDSAAPHVTERGFTAGQQTREWFINISVSKFDLYGAGFTILLFIGEIPSDPQSWSSSSSCIGSFHVFPPPYSGHGPFPKIIVYSEVALINSLSKNGYDGQDVPAVIKYLTANLQWRIQNQVDGTVVPVEDIPSLNITVQDEVVTPPEDATKLPTYGQKKRHPEITSGKAGGY